MKKRGRPKQTISTEERNALLLKKTKKALHNVKASKVLTYGSVKIKDSNLNQICEDVAYEWGISSTIVKSIIDYECLKIRENMETAENMKILIHHFMSFSVIYSSVNTKIWRLFGAYYGKYITRAVLKERLTKLWRIRNNCREYVIAKMSKKKKWLLTSVNESEDYINHRKVKHNKAYISYKKARIKFKRENDAYEYMLPGKSLPNHLRSNYIKANSLSKEEEILKHKQKLKDKKINNLKNLLGL